MPKRETSAPYRLEVDGTAVQYRLQRSARRRTLTITVHPERGVVVHAPRRLPQRDVEAFVRRKAQWVRAKQAELVAARTAGQVRWEPGALLPYRGERRPLLVEPAARARVTLCDEGIRLALPEARHGPPPPETVRAHLLAWYRKEARRALQPRVEHFAALLDVQPRRLSVRGQRTRWGSCSARGTLSFNWRLILAPAAVLDYVVVHELCHLHHPNHSARFWALVGRVLPDHARHRAWLREHGSALFIEATG